MQGSLVLEDMNYKTKATRYLQQEIEKHKQGTIMVVCLVNKNELIILLDDLDTIVEKFYAVQLMNDKRGNLLIF